MCETLGARLLSLDENCINWHRFSTSYLRPDWAELSKYAKIRTDCSVIFSLREKSGSRQSHKLEGRKNSTKTSLHVALPDNVCQQCGESIENPAPLKKGGDCLQVRRKRKLVNNLEFLVSCVFTHSDLQNCRNCTDWNEKLTKKVVKVRRNFSWCTCSMHFYLSAARKDQIEGSESKANRRAIHGTTTKQMG